MENPTFSKIEAIDQNVPEKKGEEIPISIIGLEDPALMSRELFDSKAFLYHAARDEAFQVNAEFDYSQQMMDGATLGSALYTTDSKSQAENYATIRPNAKGNVHAMLPYKARMLDLRKEEDRTVSARFPPQLAKQWAAFALPRIKIKIDELKKNFDGINSVILHRLEPYYYRLEGTMENENIDFRNDILDTDQAPFSIVDEIWLKFCKEQGIDGVIVIEGGEDHFQMELAATYAFYNLETIGTFDDWHNHKQLT